MFSFLLGKYLEWNHQANITLLLEPWRSCMTSVGLALLSWAEEQWHRTPSPLRAAIHRKEGREFPRRWSWNLSGPLDLEMPLIWPYDLDVSYWWDVQFFHVLKGPQNVKGQEAPPPPPQLWWWLGLCGHILWPEGIQLVNKCVHLLETYNILFSYYFEFPQLKGLLLLLLLKRKTGYKNL